MIVDSLRFRIAILSNVLTLVMFFGTDSAKAQEAFRKALVASEKGNPAEAEKLLTEHLEAAPEDPFGYYWRGRERLRLAKIKESVADFDQFVKLAPDRERQLWERGIALYYAGEYERGAKQFELYQTYHDADVENAAWRYICQVRAKDVATARKELLPIAGDRRPVLMDIYAMFKEEKSPDEVLAAAEKVDGGDAEKKLARFYAHLYVGLYYEAKGDAEKSLKYIREAAEKHRDPHYMGDVAAVHFKLRTAESKR
jgi:lipoprotein NlpI